MGRNRQLPHDCPICPRKDRDWIDTLLANGVPYDEVSREFRIAVVFLRRHEVLHSTKQPSMDPLAILRGMRWLVEEQEKLARRELGAVKDRAAAEVVGRRQKAILNSLTVLREYANLTDAKRHLDSRVILPRWNQVIQRLAEKMKEIPGAMDALREFAREEGPQDIGVMIKTPEIEAQLKEEKEHPVFPEHRFDECPQCKRRSACFNATCPDPIQLCSRCEAEGLLNQTEAIVIPMAQIEDRTE